MRTKAKQSQFCCLNENVASDTSTAGCQTVAIRLDFLVLLPINQSINNVLIPHTMTYM